MQLTGAALVYYTLLLDDKRAAGMRAIIETLKRPEQICATPRGHEVMEPVRAKQKPRPVVAEEDVLALQAVCRGTSQADGLVDGSHINLRWIWEREGGVPSEGENFTFKTLETLEEEYFCRCEEAQKPPVQSYPLVTSPRSALVIFRNGVTVKQLCKPPKQNIKQQAALQGLAHDATKVRITRMEARRRAHLAHLRAQYQATCTVVTRDHLSYLIFESDHRMTCSLAGSAAGKTASSNHESLRTRRLLRERALGIPTGPLVSDTNYQYKLGQIKERCWNEAQKELDLKRKIVEKEMMVEKAAYRKEISAAMENKAQQEARTQHAREHSKNCAEKMNVHKKRIESMKAADEERRVLFGEKILKRDEKLELRLEALREYKKEQIDVQKEFLEQKRLQVKRHGQLIVDDRQQRALQRQHREEEQQQRDAALRELRLERKRRRKQRQLHERRERARQQNILAEGTFKKIVTMKAEKAEGQIQTFKDRQTKLIAEKRLNGVLKDLKRRSVRRQADMQYQKWMDETVDRAKRAAEEAEATIAARRANLTVHKEVLLQKAEDKKIEKERLLLAANFRNIALIEKQRRKHQYLEEQLQQKAATTLEARTQKSRIRLVREVILRDLEESDIKAKKERAFRSLNGLDPLVLTPTQQRVTAERHLDQIAV